MKNIFLIKSNKAQASAPFEVLVAVILMGFVILAGTWALSNLSENTCIGNKRQELSELKEAIKDVVLGSDLTIKNISFDVRPCFNQKYEFITIKTYANQTMCNAFCGGGNTCTLLEYTYNDGKTRKMPIPPICIELPTAIEYETTIDNCISDSDEQANWTLVSDSNISSNIISGKYRLLMVGSSTDYGSSRRLCFLKKKRI